MLGDIARATFIAAGRRALTVVAAPGRELPRRAQGASGMTAHRGAALVIGLIVLVVMAILGIGSVRTSALQELMAGHAKDSNTAFQAAESAMQAALSYLSTLQVLPADIPRACGVHDADPTSCSAGNTATSPCCYFRNVIAGWQAYPSETVTALTGTAIGWVGDPAPHYVIEYRCANSPDAAGSLAFAATASQSNCKYYFTVAAVGFDPNTNSRAILQTTVRALR